MKSALEALGQLSEGSTVPEDFALDARSVRHAIEYDALQQALLLRGELTTLCGSLHELREGISETAHIARQVKKAIHTNVIVQSSPSINDSMLPPSAADSGMDGGSMGGASQSHQQDEERLAASLAEAFTKRNLAQERLSAVHQFLETFDLSEEDSRLLDHYNFEDLDFSMIDGNPINGTAFLKALERVKEIRQALSKTFGHNGTGSLGDGMDLSNNRAGSSLGASSALRMMEHLAQKQEQAYERLYHWLQSQLQVFSSSQGSSKKKVSFDQEPTDDDDSDMDQALQHPFVQASLFTLRHVPAFYRHMLELIASRRRQEETRIFLLALTSGYNGLPPLERLAHDSVSYVGDMLAFAFRSLSTEADVAMTIVHYEKGERVSEQKDQEKFSGGNSLEDSAEEGKESDQQGTNDNYDYAEKAMSASEILSTSLSGMARPLKSRIVHVISNLANRVDAESDAESDDGMLDELEEEGSIVRNKLTNLYEICGLLLFYISAMEKTVRKLEKADEKKGLLSNESSEDNSNALLVNITTCLEEGSKAFEATVRVYSAMLGQLASSSSDSVAGMAKALVVRIAEVRRSSPGFAQDVHCPVEECEATLSTSWVATKLVEAALPECSGLDDTAALKSAVHAVKKAGMEIVAAERLDELIEKASVSIVGRLVETETAKVLDLCGLGKVVSAWKQWKYSHENDSSVLMAASPGLSAQEIETAMKAFYASLYSPPVPSLEGEVKDRKVRKTARTKIAINVCDSYGELYADIVDNEKGGYESTDFLGHTPTQVETLFSA